MTLKQIITEERKEFLDWSLPNKNRNYPSMIEIADWLVAHDTRLLEAQAKELVESLPKEAESAEAVELTRSEPNGAYTPPFADGLVVGWNSYRSRVQEIIREIMK